MPFVLPGTKSVNRKDTPIIAQMQPPLTDIKISAVWLQAELIRALVSVIASPSCSAAH